MVKFITIFRNNKFIQYGIDDYLMDYCQNIPEGWDFYSDWIKKIFEIQKDADYQVLAKHTQVGYFDISKIKDAYTELIKIYSTIFDDDILRFIAFLKGTKYFTKIGDPTLNQWLNSVDINDPFKRDTENFGGLSFIEAIRYKNGQNYIRNTLLSTIKWISSQSGS